MCIVFDLGMLNNLQMNLLHLSVPPVKLSHFFLFFFNLAASCGLWDLSSPTRDRTWVPAVQAPSPNHSQGIQGIPKDQVISYKSSTLLSTVGCNRPKVTKTTVKAIYNKKNYITDLTCFLTVRNIHRLTEKAHLIFLSGLIWRLLQLYQVQGMGQKMDFQAQEGPRKTDQRLMKIQMEPGELMKMSLESSEDLVVLILEISSEVVGSAE